MEASVYTIVLLCGRVCFQGLTLIDIGNKMAFEKYIELLAHYTA